MILKPLFSCSHLKTIFDRAIGISILLISSIGSPLFACEELNQVVSELTQEAYTLNLTQAIQMVANKKGIPIIIRRSTFASEGLQQAGYPTKPLHVKNKSSVLPGLAGFIPLNGNAGKMGDILEQFIIHSDPSYLRSAEGTAKLKRIQEKVKHETQEAHLLLNEPTNFIKVPITRVRQGVRQILVYTSDSARATQWISPHDATEDRIAYVLGEKTTRKPIVADTDLVLIGHPKTSAALRRVHYHSKYGYGPEGNQGVINSLNLEWKNKTGNSNRLFQHQDEAHFGINPIDDEYKVFIPGEGTRTFDLRKNNPDRNQALKKYALVLTELSRKYTLFVPTPSLIKARAEYLEKEKGTHVDYQDTLEDYAKIWKIGTQHEADFSEPPIQFLAPLSPRMN